MQTEFSLHPQLEKDTLFVTDLHLSRVLLMNDSQFPWLILVPRRQNCVEIYDLPQEEINTLFHESLSIGKMLMQYFNGDKLNTGALGNLVPQLHLHHIVRFKNDIAWPSPVWGKQKPKAYSKDIADKHIHDLQILLNQLFPKKA
ncbi:MAG: HIT domain-containing protein [Arenicella sp.]